VTSVPGSGAVGMQIEGGRDGAHRQLILFKALEAEMKPLMVFNQRVRALMEEDPAVKAAVEAYDERLAAEAAKRQQQAELQIVAATAEDIAQVEASKPRG